MSSAPLNPPAAAAQRLHAVRARIESARAAAGAKAAASVMLLAVSKTQPVEAVAELAALGQAAFGENYAQEGVAKLLALRAHEPRLSWHFIGPLQSNKTRLVAEHFDWVQSIDRPKLAERLSQQRPPELAPLNVCIEVNVSGEVSKSGVPLAQVIELAQHIVKLPRLQLRGLMCIPQPGLDLAAPQYGAMQACWQALRRDFPTLDTLSMGMSDDLELAIAHGATMVRVGTALFGPRLLRVTASPRPSEPTPSTPTTAHPSP